MHAFAEQALLLEREELATGITSLKPGNDRDELLREFWVVIGMLNHGIDSEVLQKCVDRHRKRGTIPTCYSLAALLYY